MWTVHFVLGGWQFGAEPSFAAVVPGRWHFACYSAQTHEGLASSSSTAVQTLYFDGVPQTTSTTLLGTIGSGSITVGSFANGNSQLLGNVAHVAMWKRTISQAEVLRSMRSY